MGEKIPTTWGCGSLQEMGPKAGLETGRPALAGTGGPSLSRNRAPGSTGRGCRWDLRG